MRAAPWLRSVEQLSGDVCRCQNMTRRCVERLATAEPSVERLYRRRSDLWRHKRWQWKACQGVGTGARAGLVAQHAGAVEANAVSLRSRGADAVMALRRLTA